MGLPNINIAFQSTAASAVQRSEKGVVALILKDAKENGGHAYTNVTQVPSTLGAANQAYVQQAFLGYVNPPRKVLVYVLPAEAEALTDALNWLARYSIIWPVPRIAARRRQRPLRPGSPAGGPTTRPSARRCCPIRRRTARPSSTLPRTTSWWGAANTPRRSIAPGSRD